MRGRGDEWLSTTQVAELIGMSSEYVRRCCLDGRMRSIAFQSGRRTVYRIRREWVDDFLTEHRLK